MYICSNRKQHMVVTTMQHSSDKCKLLQRQMLHKMKIILLNISSADRSSYNLSKMEPMKLVYTSCQPSDTLKQSS